MWRNFIKLYLFFFIQFAYATTYVISPDSDIIGKLRYAHPKIGETLSDVAIRYDIGYEQMLAANPNVDPTHPLTSNIQLLIPSQYVLPKGPRQGIIIHLSEFRLYYFPPHQNVVLTFPVGIGRVGWDTPTGVTTIIAKEQDPIWYPTENLKQAGIEKGVIIPEIFPGGEGNPLGRYALRLGWPTYLIHGTNRLEGIGTKISAGCIRMLPEDIETLYEEVSVGTKVSVIAQSR